MPHKLLERKYQQRAQKRHEEFLRREYYIKTALYFEREAAAARQFNSWSARGPDTYTDRVEKLRKAEKLQISRDKLRKLFAEEEELYKRELDEQKRLKKRPSEQVSLKELRQKLLEKKAEQSLYYPNTCRRLRSYGFSPTGSARKFDSLNISNKSPDIRPLSGDSQKYTRYSTSSSIERALYQSHYDNYSVNGKSPKEDMESPKSTKTSSANSNKRFSAQIFEQSLHDTNIRMNEMDLCDSPTHSSSPNRSSSEIKVTELKSNSDSEEHQAKIKFFDDLYQDSKDHSNKDKRVEDSQEKEQSLNYVENPRNTLSSRSLTSNFQTEEMASQTEAQPGKSDHSVAYVQEENDSEDSDDNEKPNNYRKGSIYRKENESIGTGDISIQMYRYLKHNDLKHKILDLCQREHSFVVKQSWDEALRLREMRNELILLKNRNLFENRDLSMDENTRQIGLENIKARELLDKKRIRIHDTAMYSDEAKDLWKQWVREDDEITQAEKNALRDVYLKKLEEEWKHLAFRDKNRMSQLYDRVMIKSDLQDEHKLAEIIRIANDRQKQYMNYIAT